MQFDLRELRGQEMAKRALELAAAGGHSLLLIGPCRSGKSFLARCLGGLLPDPSPAEEQEIAAEHARVGLQAPGARPVLSLPAGRLTSARMARGLDLARWGVLIFDELPRLAAPARAVELLRQATPSVQVVATVRGCPCGRADDQPGGCFCSAQAIRFHRLRMALLSSGFQIAARTAPTTLRDLARPQQGPSMEVAARVAAARARQLARGGLNSSIDQAAIDRFGLDQQGKSLLDPARHHLALPEFVLANLLRLGRTAADLDGCELVGAKHIAESLSFVNREPLLDQNRTFRSPSIRA